MATNDDPCANCAACGDCERIDVEPETDQRDVADADIEKPYSEEVNE
ncbi:hypothetical protein ACFR9U_09615 [Halorientalis brevis]|uniref:4Fe-4S ferredoxin-type domain-containing protein n=1 Tax=Halorientalis brevis TaxID=1126241 RepID=A0ABD6CB46_9EURY|nr:hypothetical protein [Halorientalis brevis]